MSDSENEEIKVVDKRRFSEEGDSKSSDTANAEATKPPVTEPKEETKQSESAESSESENDGYPEVDFSSFVVSMATQALMMMGEIPAQGTQVPENIPAAKQTIDIIALLEEKTKGNLNENEQKLVTDILASLRMAFVQKVNKGGVIV